jgi:hypothetical protein
MALHLPVYATVDRNRRAPLPQRQADFSRALLLSHHRSELTIELDSTPAARIKLLGERYSRPALVVADEISADIVVDIKDCQNAEVTFGCSEGPSGASAWTPNQARLQIFDQAVARDNPLFTAIMHDEHPRADRHRSLHVDLKRFCGADFPAAGDN